MVYYKDLIGDAALSRAFDQKGNHPAKYIVSSGALLGLTGTTIVSLMPMPHLLYSMAKDGLVFKFLAQVNSKTEIPVFATIITGVLTGMLNIIENSSTFGALMENSTFFHYYFSN